MPIGQAPLDKYIYICTTWIAFGNPTLTQIIHNPNFHITFLLGWLIARPTQLYPHFSN
jgi:hypothetical protein